jgi:hypothetical protein
LQLDPDLPVGDAKGTSAVGDAYGTSAFGWTGQAGLFNPLTDIIAFS